MGTGNLSITDAQALKAVRERDESFDGEFYFAVITTGIYCRPSCSSRQALAENLRFFSSDKNAEQAGFRACKRCKPNMGTAKHRDMVAVARYIEAHVDQKLSLPSIAQHFDLSPTYLQKTFKATIGLSPKAFQDGIRQQYFKSLLKDGQSVTDAVFEAGYGSVSRVYEKANQKLGMSPSAYKAGAKDEDISYVCKQTELGLLMLAATDTGVCFAMFGDSADSLESQLREEFPKASLTKAARAKPQHLNQWFKALSDHLSGSEPAPSIPMDIRGTAFQIKVWRFLQSIEAGQTVSYAELAQAIGKPSAFRAAASACAKNRIAVLIPCHRVLRGDGSMGGYRWGVNRKQQLLSMERNAK